MTRITFSSPESVTIDDLNDVIIALGLPKKLLKEVSKHKNPLVGLKVLSGYVDVVFADGSTFRDEIN